MEWRKLKTYKCKSKELAKKLLQELYCQGYKWRNGKSLLNGETYFDEDLDEIYYVIYKDMTVCYTHFSNFVCKIEEYKGKRKENNKMERFNEKKHLQDFLNGNMNVKCKTEEAAKQFLQLLHENGVKWADNDTLLKDTFWNNYKERTDYAIRCEGLTYGEGNILGKPLETEFIVNENTFTKDDLEVGMTIEFENGRLAKVLKNVKTRCYGRQELFFVLQDQSFMNGDSYFYNLKTKNDLTKNDFGYSVIKIYDKSSDGKILDFNTNKLLWKREEPKIITKEVNDDTPEGHTTIITYNGKVFNYKCGCFEGNTGSAIERLGISFKGKTYMKYISKMHRVETEMEKEWDDKYSKV
jgi:hypothetical protein